MANARPLALVSQRRLRYIEPMVQHFHCTHDHVHEHDATATLARRLTSAERQCAARGLNLTEQRRMVLEHLLVAGAAVGAYDLIELVAGQTGKRVAPVTIYRALDFLVEAGLVHRIESRNEFLACPSGGGAHPQAVFMICECCGRVGETTSPAVENEIVRLAQSLGFVAKSRVIEMSGLCAKCAAPAAKEA